MRSLNLTMLPARQGDALWLSWGDPASLHHVLIDCGTEEIGHRVRQKLEHLVSQGQSLDLLVITHVDRDHIGGVLTALAEAAPLQGLAIQDTWFNGYAHLKGGTIRQKTSLESMGPAQGERLASWLRQQRWNDAFNGGPVQRTPELSMQRVFHDNLTITVLGPTPYRLAAFEPVWKEEVPEALTPGPTTEIPEDIERLGRSSPPVLRTLDDLRDLADLPSPKDTSVANGTSIVLMVEYYGRRILLAGDAYAADLIEGINVVSPNEALHLDAFKLPHHGSASNVSSSLVQSVKCDRWLFSTDGTQFHHPDASAIARIVSYGKSPHLVFNVRSKWNSYWEDIDWGVPPPYTTAYGSMTEGITLDLSPESK